MIQKHVFKTKFFLSYFKTQQEKIKENYVNVCPKSWILLDVVDAWNWTQLYSLWSVFYRKKIPKLRLSYL